MPRHIKFSRTFPAYHPKAGQPTYFVEKFLTSLFPKENYYPCKCADCGLEFMSCVALGGQAIADTGDYSDPCCPKCYCNDLNNSDFEIEDYYNDVTPKHHTIRSGHRWKKGDYFQPSVWGTDINLKSGRSGAYHSKSINIAPPTLIVNEWPIIIASEGFSIVVYINEIAVAQFKIHLNREIVFDFGYELVCKLAKNDGLETQDLIHWFTMSPDFKKTGLFDGQIICYNENLKY